MSLIIDRFILSRIERLSAFATSLSNLPRAVKIGRYRAQRRVCVIYDVPLPLHCINPTDSPRHASRLWRLLFLVKVCARAGKTLISRFNLCASGSCRALRACLLTVPEAICHPLTRTSNHFLHRRAERFNPAYALVVHSAAYPA